MLLIRGSIRDRFDSAGTRWNRGSGSCFLKAILDHGGFHAMQQPIADEECQDTNLFDCPVAYLLQPYSESAGVFDQATIPYSW